MKKFPWFSFYVSDWITGTILMSREEQGTYVWLLAIQWDQGFLPEDLVEANQGKPVSALVSNKFPVCEDGLRRNSRLEEERDYKLKKSKGGSNRQQNANTSGNRTRTHRVTEREQKGQPSQSQSQSQGTNNDNTREGAEKESDGLPCVDGYPTKAQAIAAGGNMGISEEISSRWWLDRDGDGWQSRNGHPMRPEGWHSNLKSYFEKWNANEKRNATRRNNSNSTGRKTEYGSEYSDE